MQLEYIDYVTRQSLRWYFSPLLSDSKVSFPFLYLCINYISVLFPGEVKRMQNQYCLVVMQNNTGQLYYLLKESSSGLTFSPQGSRGNNLYVLSCVSLNELFSCNTMWRPASLLSCHDPGVSSYNYMVSGLYLNCCLSSQPYQFTCLIL